MILRLLTLFLLLFGFQLQAQQSQDAANLFVSQNEDLSWVKVKSDQNQPALNFFQQNYAVYGLQSAGDMKLKKESSDDYGWSHYKFQQQYQQIPVEGAIYLLHEKEGRVAKANGRIFPDIEVNTNAQISPEQSIELALANHPAQKYRWENKAAEETLQRIKKDPNASHYPQPDLVIVDRAYPNESGQMALAYKMEVYAVQPLGKYLVYVDAQSGAIIQSYNTLHATHTHENGESHADENCETLIDGTAETRYHGTQTIPTSQIANGNYVLRDNIGEVSIETYNAKGDPDVNVDFVDDDNYWNNVNADQDEVATDAHFGAAVTYDFYKSIFDHDSYDDQGSPLISYIHVGEDFVNAFWDGTTMNYGDGDGLYSYPLTAIDVCGHELTHGITQYSAGLIYANESGALNESFSDIFGKAIEYKYVPDGFSWNLGTRMLVNPNNFFRSLADPTLAGDPKTYKGQNWQYGPGDSGGVHTNSGVQNHWFYLLVVGQEGFTESGLPYKVPELGLDVAIEIAYRNLTEYLTPSSNYEDARRGSLEAAADLYGYCSENYLAVASAWFAVGIGYEVKDDDYLMEVTNEVAAICEIPEVNVEIEIYNNGCNNVLDIGTRIPVSYQLDNQAIVYDTLELTAPLNPGEAIPFAFTEPTAVAGFGNHTIKVWSEPPGDIADFNNNREYTFLNRPFQNTDFGISSIQSPGGVCRDNPEKIIFAMAQYLGCDSLGPTWLPYTLSFKGLVTQDQEQTFFKMAPFDETFLFGSYYYTEYGFDTGTMTLNFPDDPNTDNDVGYFFIARLKDSNVGWTEPFTASGVDSAYISIMPALDTRNKTQLVNNDHALMMTGGEIVDDLGNLKVEISDIPQLFLRNNDPFVTTIDLCINVAGMDNPYLFFDLDQTRNTTMDYEQYGIDPEFSTLLGVYVDGQLIELINEDNGTGFTRYEYDLNPYKDGQHNVQLRALALTSSVDPNTGDFLTSGDNNIIDQIWIDDLKTNVEEVRQHSELLQIAPNPSFGTFNLSRKDGKTFQQGSMDVFDAAGKLQYSQDLRNEASMSFGADLVPGIYFVRIVDGEGTGFQKIVKQ